MYTLIHFEFLIRARHVKGCMEEGVAFFKGQEHHPSSGTKARIKSMFNLMLDYALEFEIVDRNYARTFDISDDIIKDVNTAKRGHMIFTQDEMDKLWANVNMVKYIDIVLIQCYSSWRPQELGRIKLSNVDLDNWTFIGGMKSDAGRERMVPIHSKIRSLVKQRYNEAVSLNSEYLLNCTDGQTHLSDIKPTYDKYEYRFEKIRDQLGLNDQQEVYTNPF